MVSSDVRHHQPVIILKHPTEVFWVPHKFSLLDPCWSMRLNRRVSKPCCQFGTTVRKVLSVCTYSIQCVFLSHTHNCVNAKLGLLPFGKRCRLQGKVFSHVQLRLLQAFICFFMTTTAQLLS